MDCLISPLVRPNKLFTNCLTNFRGDCLNFWLFIKKKRCASPPRQIIHHKSLSTSLKPSVNGYPEILQALKYFNNQNQIMKKHWKNVVTKENCNTYNQIFSKITLEKERGKSFGSTHLFWLKCKNKHGKNVFAINRHKFPSSKQVT